MFPNFQQQLPDMPQGVPEFQQAQMAQIFRIYREEIMQQQPNDRMMLGPNNMADFDMNGAPNFYQPDPFQGFQFPMPMQAPPNRRRPARGIGGDAGGPNLGRRADEFDLDAAMDRRTAAELRRLTTAESVAELASKNASIQMFESLTTLKDAEKSLNDSRTLRMQLEAENHVELHNAKIEDMKYEMREVYNQRKKREDETRLKDAQLAARHDQFSALLDKSREECYKSTVNIMKEEMKELKRKHAVEVEFNKKNEQVKRRRMEELYKKDEHLHKMQLAVKDAEIAEMRKQLAEEYPEVAIPEPEIEEEVERPILSARELRLRNRRQ